MRGDAAKALGEMDIPASAVNILAVNSTDAKNSKGALKQKCAWFRTTRSHFLDTTEKDWRKANNIDEHEVDNAILDLYEGHKLEGGNRARHWLYLDELDPPVGENELYVTCPACGDRDLTKNKSMNPLGAMHVLKEHCDEKHNSFSHSYCANSAESSRKEREKRAEEVKEAEIIDKDANTTANLKLPRDFTDEGKNKIFTCAKKYCRCNSCNMVAKSSIGDMEAHAQSHLRGEIQKIYKKRDHASHFNNPDVYQSNLPRNPDRFTSQSEESGTEIATFIFLPEIKYVVDSRKVRECRRCGEWRRKFQVHYSNKQKASIIDKFKEHGTKCSTKK